MNIPSLALTLLAALESSAPMPQQPTLGSSPMVAPAAPAAVQGALPGTFQGGGWTSQQQPASQLEAPDPNEVRSDAIQDFRGQLAPYGTWVEHPNYGTLWVPSTQYVGSDFVPYTTGGHWAYGSDYVWNSTYAFSDAPFHYGRWTWVSAYGWSWVPGAVYRGAWVSWRTDPYGYVGWAPLGPSYYWYGGSARWVYGSAYYAPYSYCHRNSLFLPNVGAVIVRGADSARIAGRSTVYAPPAYPGAGSATTPSAQGRTLASPTLGPSASAPAGTPHMASPTLASPSPTYLGLAPSAVTLAGPVRVAPALSAQVPAMAPLASSTYRPPAPTFNGPSYSAPSPPSYRPAPTFTPPSYSTPQGQVPSYRPASTYNAPSAPNYTPPSSPSYGAPRFSGPSAPSYSAPSYRTPSAPSYSAPSSPSYSAPRFSGPSAPSYSAPRFSAPSAGGMRRR